MPFFSLEVLLELVLGAVFKTVGPSVKQKVGGFDSHALPPFSSQPPTVSRRIAHKPDPHQGLRVVIVLGATALRDLRSFFERWRAKLLAVLDRWQEKPPDNEVYRLELAGHLDAVESLIVAFPRPSNPLKRKPRVLSGRR